MEKKRNRSIAERLIAFEGTPNVPPQSNLMVAFRVCEKLRLSLSVLTGAIGFRALLQRALTLATRESPTMAAVRINIIGSLEIIRPGPHQIDNPEEAGIQLVSLLVGLLITFVGEALALRLIDKIC